MLKSNFVKRLREAHSSSNSDSTYTLIIDKNDRIDDI